MLRRLFVQNGLSELRNAVALRPTTSRLISTSAPLLASGRKFRGSDLYSEDDRPKVFPKAVDRSELKRRLDELQYEVTQEKGTERPFTGDLLNVKADGTFSCVVCDQSLFDSKTKFESGSGWPSFYDVIDSKNVSLVEDSSYGMRRIEAICSGCGSHLGHVFTDGPKPTNLRYCINSASLNFTKKDN